MKVCWYEATGPAREVLRVGDLAKPQPGPGEVSVRVAFAGVNPTDVKRRSGARGPLPFPAMTPGYDAAGVIDAVGAGVAERRVGARVWVWEAGHARPGGSAAEFLVVPQNRAMNLPEGVSFAEGACLGVPALTACHGLLLGGDLSKQAVIVTGGAGAVGNYAIQLAKRLGAVVIATARGEAKAADAGRAGADHIVDPRSGSLGDVALEVTGGKGVRHMLDVDLGAHIGEAWRFIAENGSLASYGTQSDPAPVFPFPKYMYRNLSLHGIAIFNVSETAKLAAAAYVQQALEAGELWHRIDSTFPLAEIAAAHERQESGLARGKILIEL
jgi:NADPH2:quinone reductase